MFIGTGTWVLFQWLLCADLLVWNAVMTECLLCLVV